MSTGIELSPEIVRWLENPGRVVGALASVDREARPHLTRAWAFRVVEADAVDAYVFRSDASRLLEDLEERPTVALSTVEPPTYRSFLFRGTATAHRADFTAAAFEDLVAAADAMLAEVGLPVGWARAAVGHYTDVELVLIRLRVTDVFDQAPKPGAGERLP